MSATILAVSVGSPDPSRSHFDAQDYMESGTPGRVSEDGWLNRALPPATPDSSPVRAVAMGARMPLTLRGNRGAIAIGDLQQFQVRDQGAAGILESMYATTPDVHLMAQGKSTFEALKMIEAISRQPYTPAAGVQYVGEFGNALRRHCQVGGQRARSSLDSRCRSILSRHRSPLPRH